MPFIEKRLTDTTQLSTATSTIYTVPAQKTAIIKQIVVTNVSSSNAGFNLYINTVNTANQLFANTTVAAKDTLVINFSQVLNATDTIIASASANTSINIMISGVENSGSLAPGTTYLADGSVTTSQISNNAITQSKLDTSVPLSGMRNLIINGNMIIDQRYVGTSVTPSATQYVADRWQYQCNVGSKMTIGQNLNSITPPTGFIKYLGVQTGASANVTVGTGDFYCINHYIEGYNISHLNFGTASASQITLSFWVRSSIAGTHGISFRNATNNRSYPLSYTINLADTWEYKTLTLTGDITGTWQTDNTIGLMITFNLGMGSTISGPSGAWAGATYAAPTGAVKVVETNNATFYLTGVQLEKSSQATPFEQRSFPTELSMCQRYYQKSYSYSVLPGANSIVAGDGVAFAGWGTTSAAKLFYAEHKITMRGKPTLSFWDTVGNVSKITTYDTGFTGTTNVGATGGSNTHMNRHYVAPGTSTINGWEYCYAVDAELQ